MSNFLLGDGFSYADLTNTSQIGSLDDLKLPTGASPNNILTCADSYGSVVWRNTVTTTGIKLTTNPNTDYVLASDSAGNSRWEDLATLGVSSIAGTANQIYVNGLTTSAIGDVTLTLPQSIGTLSNVVFGSLSLSLAQGQLIFPNATGLLTSDLLYWNNTTKRLGVNNVAPTTTLDVTGTANISTNATIGGTLNVTGLITGTLATVSQPNITTLAGVTSINLNNTFGNGTIATTTLTATNLAGTLTTAAQANVTSLGTLSALTISGQLTLSGSAAGDIIPTVTGNTQTIGSATNYFSAIYGTSLYGTLLTPAQPNVTSINLNNTFGNGTISTTTLTATNLAGTLTTLSQPITTLSATTVTTKNLISAAGLTYDIGSSGNYYNAIYATDHYGTLRTVSQPYITTLSSVTSINGTTLTSGAISTTSITATNLTGTLLTAAQPNITSLGTLVSLAITGDLTVGGTATFTNTSSFTVTDNIPILAANNTTDTVDLGLSWKYSNTNYAALYRQAGTADYYLKHAITTVPGTTITGGTLSNLTVSNLTGTLLTPAQTNITSVGSLTSLSVAGTTTSRNIVSDATGTRDLGAVGNLWANIYGTTLYGTLATTTQNTITTMTGLTSLTTTNFRLNATPSNNFILKCDGTGLASWVALSTLGVSSITGTANQVIVSASTGAITLSLPQNIHTTATPTFTSVTANVTGNLTGSVLTASQSAITSVGTLTALTISGGLTLSGSTTGSITPAVTGNTQNIGGTLNYFANIYGTNLYGTCRTVSQPYITTLGAVTSLNSITVGAGTLSGLSSISSTNITGTLATASQPNVTTLGAVTSLNSNTIGAGTLSNTTVTSTNIIATNFRLTTTPGINYILKSDASGNGSWAALSGLGVSSITGTANQVIASASTGAVTLSLPQSIHTTAAVTFATVTANLVGNITGAVSTAAQPSITSLGTLTSLAVSGATTLSSTLGVTGATTLSSTLGVTGATTLSSTLGVTGVATLSSTLAVTSNITTSAGFIGVGTTNNYSGVNIVRSGNYSNLEGDATNGLSIATGYGVSVDYILYMGADKTHGCSYLQSVFWGNTFAPIVLNARGGSVGIGAFNSSYLLNVNGTCNVATDATVGGTLAVTGTSTLTGSVGIGATFSAAALLTVTASSSTQKATTYIYGTQSGSGTNSAVIGLEIGTDIAPTYVGSLGDVAAGIYMHPTFAPASGCTIPTAASINVLYYANTGVGSITSAYGVRVLTPTAGLTSNAAIYTDNLVIGSTYAAISPPSNGAIIKGNVGIGNSSPGTNALSVTGTVAMSSTLAVTGATTLSSTLGVTGATTLSSTLAVTGATTLSSTLAVTGAATLSNTLAVTSTSTMTGRITATGGLTTPDSLVTTISYAGRYNAMYIRNTNADPAAFAVINMGNDTGDKFYIFTNSSTKTTDGGANTTTIRTDSGTLRIGGGGGLLLGCALDAGSFNISNVATLSATSLAGTLSTAAQGSVTSLGVLTSLTISGGLTLSGSSTGDILPAITGNTQDIGGASNYWANLYATNLYGSCRTTAQPYILTLSACTTINVGNTFGNGTISTSALTATTSVTTAAIAPVSTTIAISGNVTVGTTGANKTLITQGQGLYSDTATTSINAAAILQCESTTKAFLPPRVTRLQMLSISSPAEGAVVYETDCNSLCAYNGAAWVYSTPLYPIYQSSTVVFVSSAYASIPVSGGVAVSPWIVSTGGVTSEFSNGSSLVYPTTATGTNYIRYQFGTGMANGMYKIKYAMHYGSNRGICVVTDFTNSVTLHTIDQYAIGAGPVYYEDVFYWGNLSTDNLIIQWSCSTKNAASSAYYTILANNIELQRIS